MQAPLENNKAAIVVTWDCIAPFGHCWAGTILRDFNRVYDFKIIIVSFKPYTLDKIRSEFSALTNKEIYTHLSIQQKLPSSFETPPRENPDLTKVIELVILPDLNRCKPQNEIKLSNIILLDNNPTNLENAVKKGMKAIKLAISDNNPKLFTTLADQIFQTDRAFEKAKQDLKTLKNKSEFSKEFFQQTEQNLLMTRDGYLKSRNAMKVILSNLLIAKFYELVHTVNYGMSVRDRLPVNFRAKKIEIAQKIFQLLNHEIFNLHDTIPVEDKPLLRNKITILFNAIFDQLSSYAQYNHVPSEVLELLDQDRTLDDLIKQFYVEIDEQLHLRPKQVQESCCVM